MTKFGAEISLQEEGILKLASNLYNKGNCDHKYNNMKHLTLNFFYLGLERYTHFDTEKQFSSRNLFGQNKGYLYDDCKTPKCNWLQVEQPG